MNFVNKICDWEMSEETKVDHRQIQFKLRIGKLHQVTCRNP